MRYLLLVLLGLVFVVSVAAQDTCSETVDLALNTLGANCASMQPNELCYGNPNVSVMTRTGSVNFAQAGDIISVFDVQSIHTGPFREPDEWGIALMQVQAALPNTIAGASLTLLLFGDVELSQDAAPPVTLAARTTGGINVRSAAGTDSAVLGSLPANAEVNLIGRNAAGDWVYYAAQEAGGWLFAPLLTVDGEITTLDVVPDDYGGPASAQPIQAVYFSSGIGASTCNALPQDGILIQTPDDEGPVSLLVNDVQVLLGSTIYLHAQASQEMALYVLDGQVDVNAVGVLRRVPQGAFVTIPLDENRRASGAPTMPAPYAPEAVENVPISALPETPPIAAPALVSRIARLNRCTGQPMGDVNVRQGPGTDYPLAAVMGQQATPGIAAQATGTDGMVWYQLSGANSRWIRSDLLALNPICGAIPVAESIPDVPTPVPAANQASESGSSANATNLQTTVYLWNCQFGSGAVEVPAGEIITLAHGIGRWPNPEDVTYIMSVDTHSITVDGNPAVFAYDGSVAWHGTGYGYDAFYTYGPLAPGQYIAQGYNSHPGGPTQTNGHSGPGEATSTCTIVAR